MPTINTWASDGVDGLEYEGDPSTHSAAPVALKRTRGLSVPLAARSADYTVTALDEVVTFSATATATLPTAVGNTRRYTVKNVGSGTVTMASTAGQTIDGAAAGSTTLAPGEARQFQSDGANWLTALTGIAPAANVVTLGGTQTITGAKTFSGALAVTAGNVGIGGAANSAFGLYLSGSPMSGTDQFGLVSLATFPSAATSTGTAVYAQVQTAAAAFTLSSSRGVHVAAPTIGAGSAITNLQGVRVDNQGKAGVTNAIGLYIAPQSGASTSNLGLQNDGTTSLVGNVGFYGTTPQAKPTVTGSRSANAALASLLTALSTLGLLTDSSSG